ncbi:Protein LURP-one-related 12 [Acorus calamus]|uniref:Protein LURP-one-related 12 n=1 Tax=Acorus calamus TaxID=4465 RepID=A0AAV9BZS9_ACOCL|nr:Protein LURP-one-related 12 [Acorus calamus]
MGRYETPSSEPATAEEGGRGGGGVMAVVDGGRYCYREEKHLTVQKASLFSPGDGYFVYEDKPDNKSELLFRVDSYSPDHLHRYRHELVLMDPNGLCLLTLRRRRPSLHNRWEGFLGEGTDGGKPVFTVRRGSIIGQLFFMEVHPREAYGPAEYQVEGSFTQRRCTVYETGAEDELGAAVAEVRRKVDPSTGVVLGRDVFGLTVRPGFDATLAMGLVLVLDQICGDADCEDVWVPDTEGGGGCGGGCGGEGKSS